jgi:hypothetical protein
MVSRGVEFYCGDASQFTQMTDSIWLARTRPRKVAGNAAETTKRSTKMLTIYQS